MGNLSKKLLRLAMNGIVTGSEIIGEVKETLSSIDWDEQLKALKEARDSMIEKGEKLASQFEELYNEVSSNRDAFEVTVPFDASTDEEYSYEVKNGALHVKVALNTDGYERTSETKVILPEGCDVSRIHHTVNAKENLLVITVPMAVAQPTEAHEEEHTVEPQNRTTEPQEQSESEANKASAENKLLRRFAQNNKTRRVMPGGVIPRTKNGRFAKRQQPTE